MPTLGALHSGHIALVQQARSLCSSVAASIFVNPLQFNDPEDLARYPRRPEEDVKMLHAANCDMAYLPSADDLFRDLPSITYDLEGLDLLWEGASRPGHFQGVVNVLERLFHFVRPDVALFGEKDRQQLAIIRHVARRYHWPVRIIGVPTQRAADGLALSSRNQRLSPEERKEAPALHQALEAMAGLAFRNPPADTRQAALDLLKQYPRIELDHLAIVHPENFQPLQDWNGTDEAVALIAAQVGPVRLIDNITLYR